VIAKRTRGNPRRRADDVDHQRSRYAAGRPLQDLARRQRQAGPIDRVHCPSDCPPSNRPSGHAPVVIAMPPFYAARKTRTVSAGRRCPLALCAGGNIAWAASDDIRRGLCEALPTVGFVAGRRGTATL